jgi:hypothetical protein
MLRTVAVPPPRTPDARPPSSSITREVSAPEQASLIDASRPPEEVPTASLGGAEMDALLASERKPQNVIHTNTPSAQADAIMTTGERPHVAFPSVNEAPVVLAPQLTTPQPPQAAAAPAPYARSTGIPMAPAVRQAPIPVFTPPPPSRAGLLFVLGGATLLAMAVGAMLFGLRGQAASGEAADTAAPPEAGAPVATATGTTAPSVRNTAIVSATAPPSAAPAPTSSPSAAPADAREAEARAALERLRDGIGACTRDVIGVLPGTSRAVPAAFSMLRRGTYKIGARDFASPVFACIKYRETGTQRFQIQWQMVNHPGEGRGVAWIDQNGDGKPDRAFGFRAALVRPNEVDVGEIGPLDPMPPVIKVP